MSRCFCNPCAHGLDDYCQAGSGKIELVTPPTNTPLLCKFNGNDGSHAGYIVATYRMGRFYANNGLFPINRVTGWRLIEGEGFNDYKS